jgi:hypothetical protein
MNVNYQRGKIDLSLTFQFDLLVEIYGQQYNGSQHNGKGRPHDLHNANGETID